jgi:hypothetical protein
MLELKLMKQGGDAAGAISATTVSPIYANKAGGEKPEGQSVADKILGLSPTN